MKFLNSKRTYIIIFLMVVLYLTYYFSGSLKRDDNGSLVITTWDNLNTGSLNTGNIVITWEYFQVIQFDKEIIINNSIVKNSLYPTIQINDTISDVKVSFELDFTNYFKQRYSSYINAPRYFFALKFFIWDISNGWFYNVIRNEAWWVSNTRDNLLTGAVLWKDIMGWYTWTIPWANAKVANTDRVWYSNFSIINVINDNVWKQLRIWWYLSSTKDMKWRNFTLIKNIRIEYKWPENAIQFIE